MEPQRAVDFEQLSHRVIDEMARAIATRTGEAEPLQATRHAAALHLIMSFRPRDAIEAMLAGHCVMLHEVMTDSVRDALRGEIDTARRQDRAAVIALDRAFGASLTRLERYRASATGDETAPEPVPSDQAMPDCPPPAAAPEPTAPNTASGATEPDPDAQDAARFDWADSWAASASTDRGMAAARGVPCRSDRGENRAQRRAAEKARQRIQRRSGAAGAT